MHTYMHTHTVALNMCFTRRYTLPFTYIHMHVYEYVYVRAYIYKYKSTYMYMYMYIYICISYAFAYLHAIQLSVDKAKPGHKSSAALLSSGSRAPARIWSEDLGGP